MARPPPAVGWAPRLAGLAYLVTIAAGVFAEAVARGGLIVHGDSAATAGRLLAREPLYRLGIAADLIMLVAYVVVTLLFYEMFRPTDRRLSGLAALFGTIVIAMLGANTLVLLAPLVLLHGPAGGLAAGSAEGLAYAALRLHGQGYATSLLFGGAYCGLIGWLALRSRLVPRVLGALMLAAGVAYVVVSVESVLALRLPDPIDDLCSLLELAGEGFLSLWLVVVGARTQIAEDGRVSASGWALDTRRVR